MSRSGSLYRAATASGLLALSSVLASPSAIAGRSADDEGVRFSEVVTKNPTAAMLQNVQGYHIHNELMAAHPHYAAELATMGVDATRPTTMSSFVTGNVQSPRVDKITYDVGPCLTLPTTWRHNLLGAFNKSGSTVQAAADAVEATASAAQKMPPSNLKIVNRVPSAPENLSHIYITAPTPQMVAINATSSVRQSQIINMIILQCHQQGAKSAALR